MKTRTSLFVRSNRDDKPVAWRTQTKNRSARKMKHTHKEELHPMMKKMFDRMINRAGLLFFCRFNQPGLRAEPGISCHFNAHQEKEGNEWQSIVRSLASRAKRKTHRSQKRSYSSVLLAMLESDVYSTSSHCSRHEISLPDQVNQLHKTVDSSCVYLVNQAKVKDFCLYLADTVKMMNIPSQRSRRM